MMDKKPPLSSDFWIAFISICLVLGIIMIAVYSSYFGKEPEVIDKDYEGADISISYDGDSKLLSLTDLKPTTTIEGINGTDDQFFEFTVTINKKEAEAIDYEISLVKDKTSNISDRYVKVYLEKFVDNKFVKVLDPTSFYGLEEDSVVGTKKGSMVIYDDFTGYSREERFRLRMWLSDDSPIISGTFSVDIEINAKAR